MQAAIRWRLFICICCPGHAERLAKLLSCSTLVACFQQSRPHIRILILPPIRLQQHCTTQGRVLSHLSRQLRAAQAPAHRSCVPGFEDKARVVLVGSLGVGFARLPELSAGVAVGGVKSVLALASEAASLSLAFTRIAKGSKRVCFHHGAAWTAGRGPRQHGGERSRTAWHKVAVCYQCEACCCRGGRAGTRVSRRTTVRADAVCTRFAPGTAPHALQQLTEMLPSRY